MIQKRVCVGGILKPVGIRGQVKIKPYTNSFDTILSFSKLFLEDGQEIVLLHPRLNEKGFIITSIKGFVDRTSVESLHSKELYANQEDLGELEADEYYFDDLKNLVVFDENQTEIGKVIEAFDYGAGVFLELIINNKTATLPFNKDSVLQVDLDNGSIVVNSSFILS